MTTTYLAEFTSPHTCGDATPWATPAQAADHCARCTFMRTAATAAELRRAATAGRAAYDADRPNAPGIDATVLGMVGDVDPGYPRTAQLFRAFSEAYAAEVNDAVRIMERREFGQPVTPEFTALY